MTFGQEPDPLLSSATRLRARDAVAALLVLDDGDYVMQLRDRRPDIFYPDHWGCFGGAVDANEAPLDALKRELAEEIELEVVTAVEFTRFDFDFSKLGQSRVFRIYYEVHVRRETFKGLVLHEGVAFKAISGRDFISRHKAVPYDQFAVWLHMCRERLSADATKVT